MKRKTKTAKDLLEVVKKMHRDDPDMARRWAIIDEEMKKEEYERLHPKVKCPKCRHTWRLRKRRI